MITEKVLKTLEFDRILKAVSAYAASDVARDELLSTTPAETLTLANTLLAETREADKVLFEYNKSPNFALDDVTDALKRSQKQSILSIPEFLRIARLLKTSRNLKFIGKLTDIKLLKVKVDCLCEDIKLEDTLYKSFPTDDSVADSASAELQSIRSKMRRCNDNIRSKLNSYTSSSEFSKFMQDNLVTMRNDRYVIPVKSEYRSSVGGLVHDQSASGATVYIEPYAIVEMNNEMKTLLAEERQEIERILRKYTEAVAAVAEELILNESIVTDLDCIFCRARYGRDTKCTLPVLNDKGYISVENGRHPLLAADKVVPISIKVGKKYDMLLITGPNTGGKTVTLKLVGLLTIMAASGLFVPATFAELSLFDGVYCDIGDEQSIEQNLSTFSAHIKNVKNILDVATSRSLLLFDELGAGTDPAEGAAIAVAVSEYVLKIGAKAVITTHYNDLKEFSVTTDRVENASMDFDVNTFAPTYHLIMGAIGASNALRIAQRLGLKEEIIQNATAKLSAEQRDFENVLISAESTRKKAEELITAAESDREEAEKLLKEAKQERDAMRAQREKMNENVQRETKRLVQKSLAEAEEVISEIRDILDKGDDLREEDLFEVRRLRKNLERIADSFEEEEVVIDVKEEKSPIAIGDTVYVKSLGKSGMVKSFNRVGASVKIGNVVMHIKTDDYYKIKAEKVKQPMATSRIERTTPTTFSPEIVLLGMNVEEATYAVDNYLAEAAFHGLKEVRIVHGKGSGVLRQALQQHFKNHPSVAEYRDGKYGEGERGVTIVKLK